MALCSAAVLTGFWSSAQFCDVEREQDQLDLELPKTEKESTEIIRDRVASFPGGISEVTSPNGAYIIRNVDEPLSTGNIPKGKYAFPEIDGHHLLLIKRGAATSVPFATYLRDADVLWSPDSAAFVVRDWEGSNIEESYLYRVSDLQNPENVTKELVESLDRRDKQCFANSLNTFVEARWVTPRLIELRAHGSFMSGPELHGEVCEFTLYYALDLQTHKFVRIKSTATLPNLECRTLWNG